MEYTYTEKLFVAYLEFQFNWVSCFYGVIVYCVCVFVYLLVLLNLAAPALTLQTIVPASITSSWP